MGARAKIKAFLGRHILGVGFSVVIIPLLIILLLQGWSLHKLEKTSTVAHKVWLKNYLSEVAGEVKQFYRVNAERALSLPAYTLSPDYIHKISYHFQKKQVQGVKRFFVAAFTKPGAAELRFYDAAGRPLPAEANSPETHAVNVACAPWQLLSQQGTVIDPVALTVDERDPDIRIILKPITDEAAKAVGVAGMIVDQGYFKHDYLARAIQTSLPKFFPDEAQENVIVSVYDGTGRCVFGPGPGRGQNDEMWVWLPFVFKDWRISIQSRYVTPEQWAHWNFAASLSLSILMSLVLIGGIVFTLRTASRAMKLSQMKTDFVSNVSHELRTPLSSIRVFGEFMQLGRVKEPDKISEYGQYIQTESQRLTQLINNILDFSRIESSQKNYQFERADVGELVTETLRTFEVRLKQDGFAVKCERPALPLPPVLIDPGAVAQAFMNLLDNAVKYSGAAREILVRLGRDDKWVTVAVVDYGVGLPHEEQAKIFEKFYRVSTGLVHDVKGSGLGLSIVKHIVEAHAGRVAVESELGRGSTFTIYLPVAASAAASTVGAPVPVTPKDGLVSSGL